MVVPRSSSSRPKVENILRRPGGSGIYEIVRSAIKAVKINNEYVSVTYLDGVCLSLLVGIITLISGAALKYFGFVTFSSWPIYIICVILSLPVLGFVLTYLFALFLKVEMTPILYATFVGQTVYYPILYVLIHTIPILSFLTILHNIYAVFYISANVKEEVLVGEERDNLIFTLAIMGAVFLYIVAYTTVPWSLISD